MAAVETAISRESSTPVALPGLGRTLILAGKPERKSAEEIYRQAAGNRTKLMAELTGPGAVSAAIKAPPTGHLEISALHTNDVPTTLTRTRNMGIAPSNIASSVILITAQRLARRLCPNCNAQIKAPRKALPNAGFKPDGSWISDRPLGCSACNNGDKRRGGVCQVMPRSPKRCSATSCVAAQRWKSLPRRKPKGCTACASPPGTRSKWA
jgi:hypothetical protein